MSLDPETQAFVDQLRSRPAPDPESLTIEEFRAAVPALRPLGWDREEVAEVRDLRVAVGAGGEVPVRLFRPPTTEARPPLVVCVHGGSWVRVTVADLDEYYRVFANRSGCVLAAVDYSLAPEAPFPRALEEVHAAAVWLQENAEELEADPERFGIFGESSGGNIAAATTLVARERGGVSYSQQTLLLPMLDAAMDSASWQSIGSDYGPDRDQLKWALGKYAPGVSPSEPLLSPLRADDHSGLPPALIFTGEYDPLRDDGERYAEALRAVGGEAELHCRPGLIHTAIMVPKAIPSVVGFVDTVGTALGAALGAPVAVGEGGR